MRRRWLPLAGASACLLAVPVPAAAAPTAGLCVVDEQRGAVPAGFPLEACVDAGGVVLRNQLAAPVVVRVSGDVGPPEAVDLSAAAVAGATRLLGDDGRVLAPGDVVRWSRGAGSAEFAVGTLAEPAAAPVVLGLRTLLPDLAVGPADGDRVLATLAAEVGAAVRDWGSCTDGASTIGRTACDLRAADRIGTTLARHLRARITDDAAEIALDAGRWAEWVQAAGTVGAAVAGDRPRLVQHAVPSPPAEQAPAPQEPATPPIAPRRTTAPVPAPPPAPAPAPAPAPVPAPAPAPVPAPPPVVLPEVPVVAVPPPGRDLRGEIEQWLRDLAERFEEHRGSGDGWGRGGRWGD